jgi:thiamine monophosphate synthase
MAVMEMDSTYLNLDGIEEAAQSGVGGVCCMSEVKLAKSTEHDATDVELTLRKTNSTAEHMAMQV